MNPFFSVAVPACQVESYVERTIESIRNQTYREFEAIICYEESTDNTLSVIENAIKDDPRFRIVRNPRSGTASVSRNYGIEHAIGEYIVFVDGDDWIELDSLQRFYEDIEKYNFPDILLADWMVHYAETPQEMTPYAEKCHNLEIGRRYTGEEAFTFDLNGAIHTGSFSYICRRQYLLDHHLRQVPGRRYQDDEWIPRLMLNAQSVVYSGITYYHYFRRSNSITTDANPKYLDDFIQNFISHVEYMNSRTISPNLRKAWSHWLCRIIQVFFSTSSCRRFPRDFRQKKFMSLVGSPKDFRRFLDLARNSGISKKILIPLLYLAKFPYGFLPAEMLYRYLYWPVVITFWSKIKARKFKK